MLNRCDDRIIEMRGHVDLLHLKSSKGNNRNSFYWTVLADIMVVRRSFFAQVRTIERRRGINNNNRRNF